MSFTLPDLPYAFDALAPHIDARTMEIHRDKHHRGYMTKVNNAIEDTDLAGKSIEELLGDPSLLPEEKRQYIMNNGGGYYNHCLFWPSLSPDGGGKPSGALATAIDEQFGSFEQFRENMSKKALTLFGSGRVYLCKNDAGELVIKRHSFQETPLKYGLTPLLGLDVWEHAYYLHYQNRRGDYLKAWRNIINWDEIEKRFTA